MKKLFALCLAALTATAAFAADALPVFNATLTVGKDSRFVLIAPDGKASTWLKVGDTFEGYNVKAYDAKANALELEKDGKMSRVTLAADAQVANGTSAMPAAPATLEDATGVLNKMHFDEVLAKVAERQKKMVASQIEMGVKRAVAAGVSQEDADAYRDKILGVVDSMMNPAELKTDITKIYSEVFNKDELNAMSAFYSTPLGEAIANKQADVQDKLAPVIQQKMMQSMPKIQQLTQEFQSEQRAKKQAAAAAAPAPAAAAAPAASTPAPAPAPAPAPKP
jgi:hypothetical protein